jgi:threonine synthase
MCESLDCKGVHTIIDSTASPYKFSGKVVKAIDGKGVRDEFRSIARLHDLTGLAIHRAVKDLRQKEIRHNRLIPIGGMRDTVLGIVKGIRTA